jgi:hypothetical protein
MIFRRYRSCRPHVLPLMVMVPWLGACKPFDHLDEGGFAGAVGSEQRQVFVLPHVQSKVADGYVVFEGPGNLININQCFKK